MKTCTFVTYLWGCMFPRKKKLEWYHQLSQSSNREITRQVTSYYEEYRCMGKYYSSTLLDEYEIVPFENIEAYITKKWHECLCVQFGNDYMTPPKEEERVSRHVNLNI